MVFNSPGLVACACVLSTANSLPAAGHAQETAVELQSPSAPLPGPTARTPRIFQRGHEEGRADLQKNTVTHRTFES